MEGADCGCRRPMAEKTQSAVSMRNQDGRGGSSTADDSKTVRMEEPEDAQPLQPSADRRVVRSGEPHRSEQAQRCEEPTSETVDAEKSTGNCLAPILGD